MKPTNARNVVPNVIVAGIVVLAASSWVSCSRQDARTTEKPIDFLPDEPASNEVANLRVEIASLSLQSRVLSNRVFHLARIVNGEQPVEIDVARTGFLPIPTKQGVLFVSCKEATPYLNGHKLLLEIGNPLSANLSGIELECEYGLKKPEFPGIAGSNKDGQERSAAFDKYDEEEVKHLQSLRTVKTSLTQVLASGTWTDAELLLVPSTTEELGHVELKVRVNTVSLVHKPSEK